MTPVWWDAYALAAKVRFGPCVASVLCEECAMTWASANSGFDRAYRGASSIWNNVQSLKDKLMTPNSKMGTHVPTRVAEQTAGADESMHCRFGRPGDASRPVGHLEATFRRARVRVSDIRSEKRRCQERFDGTQGMKNHTLETWGATKQGNSASRSVAAR